MLHTKTSTRSPLAAVPTTMTETLFFVFNNNLTKSIQRESATLDVPLLIKHWWFITATNRRFTALTRKMIVTSHIFADTPSYL